MIYKRSVNFIAGFVVLISIAVMLGWFLNISFLKSILPGWATMKFTTALCFLLAGITLYFISQMIQKRVDYSLIILSFTSFSILLLMGTLLVSSVSGIRTGLEDLFVKEAQQAVLTVTPGRPSMGTVIAFMLIAICSVLIMLDRSWSLKIISKIGWMLVVMGSIAVAGYVFNIPVLFFVHESLSFAMAMHTAILFILLGSGHILAVRI